MRRFRLLIMISAAFFLLDCTEDNQTIEEGFVTSDQNIQLFYRIIGNGPEKIIIPAGQYLADEFENLASENRTLLFYDQRGRGKSDAVHDRFQLGMNFEVSDLEKIRRQFGFDQISLIGWSYLGAVVARYTIEFPEMVKRVVQICPIPPKKELYWDEFQATLSSRQDIADKIYLEEMLQKGLDKRDPERYSREYHRINHKAMKFNPDMESKLRSDYYTLANEMPNHVWNFHIPRIIESLSEWDWRSELDSLGMQFLTIHGDYDAIPMEAAKEWTASLPEGHLLVIPDAGHFPWLEQPDQVFPAIDSFLTGVLPENAVRIEDIKH